MVEIVVEQKTNIKPHIALSANARILPPRLDDLPISRPDDQENSKVFSSDINFCFIIYSVIFTNLCLIILVMVILM